MSLVPSADPIDDAPQIPAADRSAGVSETGSAFVVEPSAIQTPGDRRAWIDALLERVQAASLQADRLGKAVDLTIHVKPSSGSGRTPAAGEVDALDQALAAARIRGAARIAEILKAPDMVTAREFGPLVGMSHETVNQKRKAGQILGLRGSTRGYRFPTWQVTPDGLPLPGLRTLFAILGEQPWTIHRFLLTQHNELSGETALEALKAGRLEAVFGVARNIAMGVFA